MDGLAFKICRKCGASKPLFEFPKCRGSYRARCKPCHTIDACEWQKKNREKATANGAAFRERRRIAEGREKREKLTPQQVRESKLSSSKKWRDKNSEKFDAMRKKWAKENKHKVMEVTRRYQAKKRAAVPGWASKTAMAGVYRRALELSKATGIKHHVDHIVPLTSNLVCGLHCEDNLQVLPHTENRRKHNRYWPDMPELAQVWDDGHIQFRGEIVPV